MRALGGTMRLDATYFQLSFLRDAARLVDSRLREIETIAKRGDIDLAESMYDTGEYLLGFGLVACQQFVSFCISQASVEKKAALSIGPQHACGASMVSLVNALANRWKHEAGWGKRPSPQEMQTIATLTRLGLRADDPYFTASALVMLLRPHAPRIQKVIPFLKQWSQGLKSAA
jgi:hypothetical protein